MTVVCFMFRKEEFREKEDKKSRRSSARRKIQNITVQKEKAISETTGTTHRDTGAQRRDNGWEAATQRWEGGVRGEERDECSGILRSEGKSPSVLVLLERLALTHEYFILLMFKSHHLRCGAWACVEIRWNEGAEGVRCVWGRVCWSIMHSFSKFTCDIVYCICISALWKEPSTLRLRLAC